MKRLFMVMLLTVFMALATAAFADTIRTKNGKELKGTVIEQTDEYVRLRTGYGDLTIPRSDIESIKISSCVVRLKDGRTFEGIIIEEDTKKIVLRTKYGELVFPRKDIEKIERGESLLPGKVKKPVGKTPEPPAPPAKKLTPQERQALHQKAIKLLQERKLEESIDVYKEILASIPDDMLAWYNLACAYSLNNDIQEAIDALEKSIEYGYSDFAHMERDTDLDNIRNESGYKSLLARKDEILKHGAQKRVAALKKKYGDDYIVETDEERKIIYATNQSRVALEEMKKFLNAYADAQWRTLFPNKPTYYITVLCPSDEDFNRIIGGRRGVGGFYNHQGKTLVCRGIGMTLRHEFTHALHFADLSARGQMHPIWFAEGLATCFEESHLVNGIPTPLPNGRLNMVRLALATGRYVPWSNLFKLSHPAFMQNAGINYAEVRYITVWLWEIGKLKEFYDTFCATFNEDSSGITAMERIFGKSIDEVQEDFKKWIASAPEPVGATPTGAPFFGVGTEGTAAGMQVRQVVPGSSADKAGIKPGDIIVEFAGKKYTNRDEFAKAIRAQKVGETIKVKVLRGNEFIELDVKLLPKE